MSPPDSLAPLTNTNAENREHGKKGAEAVQFAEEERTMRIARSLAAAACALTLAYTGEAAAIMSNMSGFIQPKGGKVVGPLVITSMQCAVDPAAVQRCYLIYNSTQASNIWISVDDFQGPLFLAAGDKLEGREDWTKAGVVYTAFKKQ